MDRLLIVSNRLPVTLVQEGTEVRLTPSSGGLATALRGPHERGDSLWIGWPGDPGRLSHRQRQSFDAQLADLRAVPVPLSPSEATRFYDGFSNGVLWPLLHYLIDKVRLDAHRDWQAYRQANEKFADAVVARHRPGDLIWVHDYQLTLVPGLLRKRLPNARIGFFLHVPFPASDVFRLLPWREEILRGLLGADLIGFHTAAYRAHFADTAARVLGIESDLDALQIDGRSVRLEVHPIGIDVAGFEALAADPAVQAEAAKIRAELDGRQLVLGVDRLDYTKGIRRRLMAFERYLQRHPEQRSKVRLLQLAVPTREKLDSYAEFRRSVEEMVGRINGQHGTVSDVPIHLLHRSVSPAELVALYLAADVMLVTPLRDGMNLVAKEFAACRVDGTGTLILSEFAGAAEEMTDALQVNPYDLDHVATALEQALAMPAGEQAARMTALREVVAQSNVHAWAQRFLDRLGPARPDASGVRGLGQPHRVEAILEALAGADGLDLLLDYDGTLVPLQARPERAVPDGELATLLSRLADLSDVRVHVVSGRSREDLERFLGDLPIGLHAEHGFWSRNARGVWQPVRAWTCPWKPEVLAVLQRLTAGTGGSLVEEKASGLAWHYRLADPTLAKVRIGELNLALVDLLRDHDLELVAGAKVVEVRPRGVNKGVVVAPILATARTGQRILAIGDDHTDEDLFAGLPAEAVTVRVGPGQSRAAFRLEDPQEVRRLLHLLAAELAA